MRRIAILNLILLFCVSTLLAAESAFPDQAAPELPVPPKGAAKEISIFNGKDLSGFAGEDPLWLVENGEIVGRAPKGINHNSFLASKQRLGDFRLRLKIMLVKDEGNSGVQIRSQALPHFEAKGYQADAGPGWWGKIYEENGRGLLADAGAPEGVVKKGDWNEYEILCVGDHTRTALNGVLCSELNDPKGAKEGVILVQLHAGGPTEVRVKDIRVTANPEDKMETVTGAPDDPALEAKTFTLPEGFVIELVAAEPDIVKTVDISFDDAGRMWATTDREYPVDENESHQKAFDLYKNGGRDKIMVFDTPTLGERQRGRVFAENLAMPMSVLPYKDGAIIQHGTEILFLHDTDGDGKVDKKEVLLSGFGVQDSHLFPHRFTRGPGDWVYLGQGAFNSSKVLSRDGKTTQFDNCKFGRFKLDGSSFQTVGVGLNNIWGFVIDRQGEMFIQEANDLGYPVVPFYIGASYPGIANHKFKPYAPMMTPLAKFQMGGTGLSGLALSDDKGSFPAPYNNIMYLANPITRKINAIQINRKGSGYELEKKPDFISSTDPMFRPIAIHFGPDSCLYIVDWYNKIISHNEVPRTHPDRDKTHGRVWRVRHTTMERRAVPDMIKAPDAELVAHLSADNTWECRAAWHQIVDRKAVALAPQLKQLAGNPQTAPSTRIVALWCLGDMAQADLDLLRTLTKDENRNIRREVVRLLSLPSFKEDDVLAVLGPLAEDSDPQVRAEVIRTLDGLASPGAKTIELLARMGKAPIDGPTIKTQQDSHLVHLGEAADRDFERYLVRASLEKNPQAVLTLLNSDAGKALPFENRLICIMALDPKEGSPRLAQAMPEIKRNLSADELNLLVANIDVPGVGDAFIALLKNPQVQANTLSSLLQLRDRLKTPSEKLIAEITTAARELIQRDASDANQEFVVRLAGAFRLSSLESNVIAFVSKKDQSKARQITGIKALREMNCEQAEVFQQAAMRASPGDELQREAIGALAGSKNERALGLLLEMWPTLTPGMRKIAVDRLTSSPAGGEALLKAMQKNEIRRDEIDGYALGKLQAVLGDNKELAALLQKWGGKMKKVLRLNGGREDCALTNIDLSGAFTVETWVKLDAGIGNEDSILGNGDPAAPSFNFYDSHFRVYWGSGDHDVIVAKKPMQPESWTHIAVTRSDKGEFKIYLNGELDNDKGKSSTATIKNLSVGRANVGNGTSGSLMEYRVWNVERNASEIRDNCNFSFQGDAKPAGLVHYFPGDDWGKLGGGARVDATSDLPMLVSGDEARELKAKFDTFRKHAEAAGDAVQGKALFTKTCMLCHKVQGEGADIGPALNGAGAMGTEALLRAILTPSAAVESGYRAFRVETREREIIDGFMLEQDNEAITLRLPGRENQRVLRSRIKRAGYTAMSLMPEGLLEGMKPEDIANLFAYLKTLK